MPWPFQYSALKDISQDIVYSARAFAPSFFFFYLYANSVRWKLVCTISRRIPSSMAFGIQIMFLKIIIRLWDEDSNKILATVHVHTYYTVHTRTYTYLYTITCAYYCSIYIANFVRWNATRYVMASRLLTFIFLIYLVRTTYQRKGDHGARARAHSVQKRRMYSRKFATRNVGFRDLICFNTPMWIIGYVINDKDKGHLVSRIDDHRDGRNHSAPLSLHYSTAPIRDRAGIINTKINVRLNG